MTDDTLRTRIEAFASALAAGDEAGMREFLSRDYFGHSPAPGEPTADERWTELMPAVRTGFPDLRIAVESIDRSDGVANVQAVVSGTHTGTLWGIPPSGKAVSVAVAVQLREAADGFAVNLDMAPPVVVGTLREIGAVNAPDEMHLPSKYPVDVPEFLLKLAFTARAADLPCAHLAGVKVTEPATTDPVCEACVASGDIWPALRMCLTCGFVGCCDTSVNKHAKAHFEETGHPLIRSIRMSEGWIWCYVDNAFFERRTLDEIAARLRSA